MSFSHVRMAPLFCLKNQRVKSRKWLSSKQLVYGHISDTPGQGQSTDSNRVCAKTVQIRIHCSLHGMVLNPDYAKQVEGMGTYPQG